MGEALITRKGGGASYEGATVTAETILNGYKGWDANGNLIVGTLVPTYSYNFGEVGGTASNGTSSWRDTVVEKTFALPSTHNQITYNMTGARIYKYHGSWQNVADASGTLKRGDSITLIAESGNHNSVVLSFDEYGINLKVTYSAKNNGDEYYQTGGVYCTISGLAIIV